MELDRFKDVKLHGIGKILHQIVLILTYPFRHIFKFLAFLFVAGVILASIPMMKGVSYTHIVDWYLLRYHEAKKEAESNMTVETTPVLPAESEKVFKEVAAPKIIRKHPAAENSGHNGARRAFKRAEAPFRRIEVKEKPEMSVTVEKPSLNEQVIKNQALPKVESNNQNRYYRIDKTLPLVYEDNPVQIEGRALVFSANDLTVGDTYLYLYGVYTDPQKYDMQKAVQYLEELTNGKTLVCQLVAYTYQNIATGVCFLDGRSVNQNLVDAGFADNIAL